MKKVCLVGINAKYIHPNLAIRLLKANTTFEVELLEFNIKEKIETILKRLLVYDVISFSTYIWNIELIKNLLVRLKNLNKIIILGGPEVSYNASFYLKNNLAKYVIKNEGEEAFDKLLRYILLNDISIESIPNLYYKDKFTFDKKVEINKIKLAYDQYNDVVNQIVYFETSRGCPFSCAYCMAGIDNHVRFFQIAEIKKELLSLINKGAKTFKFLDRTFNLKKEIFLDIIDFLIKNHHPGQSFQFEITGDILEKEVIEFINKNAPKHLFRFEIGIQSTNEKVNKAVNRNQNNKRLFENILLIQNGDIIDLHLDLIAGLPYEDYFSFQKSFNDVLSLRPKELQLGFLKLLSGTKLKEEKDKYDYCFLKSPPYEIIKNKFLSKNDLDKIHIVEDSFEKYYNALYFKKTINYILDNVPNGFEFFLSLGYKFQEVKPNSLEKRFALLDKFCKENFQNDIYLNIHYILVEEYLSFYKVKPHVWWEEKDNNKTKNETIRKLKSTYLLKESLDNLYRHSILVHIGDHYLLALFYKNGKEIYKF